MSDGPGVWITRAEPGAAATAARLSTLGFTPLVAPLLSLQPIPVELDLKGVSALAFTSRNGVEAFCAMTPVRDLPVFAVGDATAQAARTAGFATVSSADGDVLALANLIERARPEGVVLHATGLHRAGDLVGRLGAKAIPARLIALYDTVAALALPAAAARALSGDEVSAVLIHSPRAGRILSDLTAGLDVSRVHAVGLSPACLASLPASRFAGFAVAQTPREEALIDALFVTLGISPRRR